MQENQVAKATDELAPLKVLNNEQMQNLLATVSEPRDYLALAILYETGCNLKELTSIKVDDVSSDAITFRGKNERHSSISPELTGLLNGFVARRKVGAILLSENLLKSQWYMRSLKFSSTALKPESDYLFATRQSATMTERRVRQLVRKYTNSIGMPLKTKVLRYSHVMQSYQQQKKVAEIGQQTGLKRLRLRQIIKTLG